MKSLNCALLIALTTVGGSAAVVNDGTTAAGLVRRAPEPILGSSTTTLSTTADGNLEAVIEEPSDFNFPALHTVWFSEAYAATGDVYQVSAAFVAVPDLTTESGGGTVGWFDEATGVGIVFSLKSDAAPYTAVEIYDFDTGARPRDYLYDTNGVEVHPDFSQAWKAALGAGFRSTNMLVLELAFAPPSTNDLSVLSNATARFSARARQDNGQGLQDVGQAFEFLTTLPRPASEEKRFGYYAVYNPVTARSGPIGRLDNLVVDGEFGLGNQRPSVSLSSPAAGAVFAPGAAIFITADATDPDPGGRVVNVDFFVGDQLIGSATAEPFTVAWNTTAVGDYELTAVARDERGASQVSGPVTISVGEIVTDPPTLTITREDAMIILTWDRSGFRLEASSDLGGSWVEVATAGTEHTETIAGGLRLFRLVGSGVPGGPSLTVSTSGGNITISWNQTGYQLESTTDLGTTWDAVLTQGMQHTESASGSRKFYRLTR